MKKKTPMEMRKEGKNPKSQPKQSSSMERYIQKRSKKPAPPVMIESK